MVRALLVRDSRISDEMNLAVQRCRQTRAQRASWAKHAQQHIGVLPVSLANLVVAYECGLSSALLLNSCMIQACLGLI